MNFEIIAAPDTQGEIRLDSRALADHMGNQHKNVLALINRNLSHFEGFGTVAFQTRPLQGGGLPERFTLLNENQCYFLLTLVRNSEVTVPMKAAVVAAFAKARQLLSTPAPQPANQPASSPALINCHGVAQAFGITRTAAQLKIKRAHLQPVAHYVDVCPGYLYRLADVQAEWPEITFQPFSGEVREGLKPVQRPLERRAQRQPMPRLLDAQPVTDRVEAAQELVQLEQRRAYLLGVLA